MRVFVTGGTGFIGHHVCRRFVERGDRVTALVRSPAKAAARLPPGVETLAGDLSIFADTRTELPACDAVVHLAGVVAADRAGDYEAINFGAVRDLLGCLARQTWRPKRFLLASSLAAGGPSPPGTALTELDPPRPIEPYGRAKARAETVALEAPFPATCFRPPIVFGPGDEASLTLFRAARSGLGLRVAGAPQRLSYVDVRDLADAVLAMTDDTRSSSHVYYASHPSPMDVRELWVELGRAVGRDVTVVPVPRAILYLAMLAASAGAAVFRYKNQLDAKQYAQMAAPAFVCSSAKLRSELGWTPRYGLAECLAHAAEGYRAAGLLRGGRAGTATAPQ
jgi:nucleoside-diphosphate-sugar epimerase